MAKQHKVQIRIQAQDEATRTLKGIQAKFDSFAGGMRATAGLIGAAIAGRIGGAFLEANKQQEQASAKLRAAMRAQGIENEALAQQMENYSSALQKVTTVGDEVTTSVQATLVSFTGMAGKGIMPLTKAALDLAAGMNMDAESAAQLIAKTIEGQDALGRYGISVKGATTQSERMAKIVEQVNTRFKDFAEAKAKTAAGAMEQLKNAWGDNLEELGKRIAVFSQSFTGLFGSDAMTKIGQGMSALMSVFLNGLGAIYASVVSVAAGVEWVLNKLGITESTAIQEHMNAAWDAVKQQSVQAMKDIKALISKGGAELKVPDITEIGLSHKNEQAEKLEQFKAAMIKAHGDVKGMKTTWDKFLETVEKSRKEIKGIEGGVQSVGVATSDLSVSFGDTFALAWAQGGGVIRMMNSGIYELSHTISDQMTAAWERTFGEANSLFEIFMQNVWKQLTELAASSLLKAVAGGILSIFGGGVGGLFGIFHSGGKVPKAHDGLHVNAPSSREIPLLVRGGETIRTEQQEAMLQGRLSGLQAGGVTVQIVNYGTVVDGERFVLEATRALKRKSGRELQDMVRDVQQSRTVIKG